MFFLSLTSRFVGFLKSFVRFLLIYQNEENTIVFANIDVGWELSCNHDSVL